MHHGYTFIAFLDENKIDKDSKIDIFIKYDKKSLKNYEKSTANILGVSEEDFKNYLNPNFDLEPEELYKNYQKFEEEAKYKFDTNNYLIRIETNPLGDSSFQGIGAVALIICRNYSIYFGFLYKK